MTSQSLATIRGERHAVPGADFSWPQQLKNRVTRMQYFECCNVTLGEPRIIVLLHREYIQTDHCLENVWVGGRTVLGGIVPRVTLPVKTKFSIKKGSGSAPACGDAAVS